MLYVYMCVSSNRKKTLEEVQHTRKYKKALDLVKIFKTNDVIVDVCTPTNRKKPNLERILTTPENIIIISDVAALGRQDDMAKTYQRIIDTQNDILVCYFDASGALETNEISSVTVEFKKKNDFSLESNLNLLNNITSNQFNNVGCTTVNDDTVEAYWQHEKGEKSMNDVLETLGITRNTFLKKIAHYVGTDAWVQRILKEEKDITIHKFPMRIGEVSENGKKMYEFLEKNPEDYLLYPLSTIAYHAGVDKEILDNADRLSWSDNKEESDMLANRYEAIAIHTYREVLKYRKYIFNLKYRK